MCVLTKRVKWERLGKLKALLMSVSDWLVVLRAHPIDDPDYAFMKLVGITAQVGKTVYQVK